MAERKRVGISQSVPNGGVEGAADSPFIMDDDHFVRCSIWQYIVITFGLTVFVWLALFPTTFPYDSFGGPGTRLKYITDNYLTILQLCVPVVVIIHTIEATVTSHKCLSLGMTVDARQKWIAQTLLLGYASLQLLSSYEEETKIKQAKHS